MKKFILGALMTVAMLFAGVANAEFVIGISGGWAQVRIDEDELGADCGSSETCDLGDGFGFGVYGQGRTPTKSGDAWGIHVGWSSFSIEGEIYGVDLDYDADVLDILGMYVWNSETNTAPFIRGGFSKAEVGSLIDVSGFKIVGGWEIGTGNALISPTISYAAYEDGFSSLILSVGIGYKF